MPQRQICKRMKCTSSHILSGAIMKQRGGAAKHLLRGAARERQQQYRLGIDSHLHQPRHAVGERPRLARPRAGNDERWTIHMLHRFELRGVQLLIVLDFEARFIAIGQIRGALQNETLWRNSGSGCADGHLVGHSRTTGIVAGRFPSIVGGLKSGQATFPVPNHESGIYLADNGVE